MKYKKTIIILILILTIFFSGCSKEVDCSDKNNDYETYSWNKNLKECVISDKKEKNVCGNTVIEGNENHCNCPSDVPSDHATKGCGKTIGDFIQESCNEDKECVFAQNEKVIEQTKSVEFKNSYITFNGKIIYNQPYIFNIENDNNIEIELFLFKLPSNMNVKNLMVKELKIEDYTSNLLGSVKYNEGLERTDEKLKTKTLELSQINQYEQKTNLKLKLDISYTLEYLNYDGEVTKSEERIETLQSFISNFEMLNPNFYQEE